ncbi:5-formyltetrahydrofolate cyclo-ligase [Amycolatopsis marina]|uniref:5-formyltetrahydrofolate cyclo-ligase n=1 Tax=Amycolatopsis marina TaxID=490629 RepID=A0A1I1BI83_9PSEU|nr:5-formyltetrahydrofolate cyclo-ligase [Amycolatopsis marina]SFB48200.1 5-formyltetrahydrofolate cyclo-ligase [Amycolatopsis marina]
MHPRGNERLSKTEWRAHLLARRAGVPPAQRAAEADALALATASIQARTVCCYVPFGDEPGSLALLDALRDRGVRVLLPIVPPRPGPLDWAEYTGSPLLVQGRFRGLMEPAGERLGSAGVAAAEVVLVPALAVDHRGVRLGRGAGFYDRTLPLARPGTAFVAVIRDTELVRRLPAEAHDTRMDAVLTPGRGMLALPERGEP